MRENEDYTSVQRKENESNFITISIVQFRTELCGKLNNKSIL